MAKSEDVVVIGLGRFGRALGETLTSLGFDVLGIDMDPGSVRACVRSLNEVVEADGTDVDALRALGVGDAGTAVCAIGTNMEASVLTTAALVDLEIPRIWAKAFTHQHATILERLGADRVIFPERDMGVRVGHSLIGRTIEYVELDPAFALVETTVPARLDGQTVAGARLRSKHGITAVAFKRAESEFEFATAETVLQGGDLVLVAGSPKKVEAFAKET